MFHKITLIESTNPLNETRLIDTFSEDHNRNTTFREKKIEYAGKIYIKLSPTVRQENKLL